MKEIELTDSQYQQIKDLANKEFNNKNIQTDHFLCKCYLYSFKSHLNLWGYVVIDGKIYEKEKNSN